MTELVPTPEQQAILDRVRSSKVNIMTEALAGAAKTSTLEMIAKQQRSEPILAVAFNKRIADEMTKRLPGHVKCMTLNGLGHRAFSSALGKHITLNTDKMYGILKEEQDQLVGDDLWEAREVFGDTLAMLKKTKALGWIPSKLFTNIKHLHGKDDEFFEDLEVSEGIMLSDQQIDLIRACISRSINQAFDGTIDFDDQIYMSTLFMGNFPKFPLTLCDEVQDFSVLNQEMISKVVEKRRIIGVGDPYQSIYAFRGADAGAMPAMVARFNMEIMTLSVSFRCPIVGVELARRRAPHMQYPTWAKQGEIRTWDSWTIKDIPDDSFVLCRNNAPLFYLALQFLKKSRGVNLVGSQLSKGLVRIMKKLGKGSLTRAESIQALDDWRSLNLKKAKTEAKQAILEDKYDCILVFLNAGKTLDESLAYAEVVFNSKGRVSLMSIHKSKGLENEHVFHLDSHLVAASWIEERYGAAAMQQEYNLQYVGDTRFKETYTYITTEGLEDSKKGYTQS